VMATVALIAVVAVIAVIALTRGNHNSSSATATSSGGAATTPVLNTGPFTGVYRADYGPELDPAGRQLADDPASGTYDFRSSCQPSGCVATATARDGPTLRKTLVFDDVDGGWLAVELVPNPAPQTISSGLQHNCPGEPRFDGVWEVITIRPGADATLAGSYMAQNAHNCDTRRTVTFTRIGDLGTAAVADPAVQAPRIIVPAQSLHGRYRNTRTIGTNSRDQGDAEVTTYCLRTEPQCMSYFIDPVGGYADALVFADGKWTQRFDGLELCDGIQSRQSAAFDYPLPEPQQNPINSLTGNGHLAVAGGTTCDVAIDAVVEKYERTGD
jgi:hypothetical protein